MQHILAIPRRRHKVRPAEIRAVPVTGNLDNVAGAEGAHGVHPGGGGFAEVGEGGARGGPDVHGPVGLGIVGLVGGVGENGRVMVRESGIIGGEAGARWTYHEGVIVLNPVFFEQAKRMLRSSPGRGYVALGMVASEILVSALTVSTTPTRSPSPLRVHSTPTTRDTSLHFAKHTTYTSILLTSTSLSCSSLNSLGGSCIYLSGVLDSL